MEYRLYRLVYNCVHIIPLWLLDNSQVTYACIFTGNELLLLGEGRMCCTVYYKITKKVARDSYAQISYKDT